MINTRTELLKHLLNLIDTKEMSFSAFCDWLEGGYHAKLYADLAEKNYEEELSRVEDKDTYFSYLKVRLSYRTSNIHENSSHYFQEATLMEIKAISSFLRKHNQSL